MKPKLWLTYAWVDNEDNQVDHVYHELSSGGLEVRLDRTQIKAGQRIWPQIDELITNPTQCDAWAIYATKRSLESEACREELAYALDRALGTRGTDFPLIGIFAEPVDHARIPTALTTRLYVDLRDPEWKERILDALQAGRARSVSIPKPRPYYFQIHPGPKPVIEIRPRSGRWYPCAVMVPAAEKDRLEMVLTAPSGRIPGPTPYSIRGITMNDLAGMEASSAADGLTSAYATFKTLPTRVVFGTPGELYEETT